MRFRATFVFVVAASASVLSNCGGGGGSADNPAAPKEISTCASGATTTAPGSVNLSWDAITAANLSGYRVYYGTAPSTYLQPPGQGLNAGNMTSYAISGLKSGTRYYFAITAYDAANTESAYSSEVCKVIP